MPCVCRRPFKYFQIEADGDCFFCCSIFVNNEPIGNIFDNSFEDIWYGEKAEKFRRSVLDETYKYCRRDLCSDFVLEDIDYDFKPELPEEVHLSYVRACNLRCITCRDNFIIESKENTEYFNSYIDKILPFCKTAKTIYLNGAGELFVSHHLCEICKRIIEVNPEVKFFIHTNGLFFNKQMCEKFGFLDNIYNVGVSIHAATEKTYNKIVRGGNWKILQRNLSYISKLKKAGKIERFKMFFVVSSLNYKEMPKFVKMAKKYGAVALFWRFRNWGTTEMCKEYDKYTCWEKDHKDYKKFIKVLYKLKCKYRSENEFSAKFCWISDPLFKKLQAEAKGSFFERLKNKIF